MIDPSTSVGQVEKHGQMERSVAVDKGALANAPVALPPEIGRRGWISE